MFLGFGKFARADKIYALEPLRGDERGEGRRTRVWVEGMTAPIIASRTERTILQDMGDDAAAQAPIVADALDLARRLADAADAGRVDLSDLGRARPALAGSHHRRRGGVTQPRAYTIHPDVPQTSHVDIRRFETGGGVNPPGVMKPTDPTRPIPPG